MGFNDKYRLELHWRDFERTDKGICLHGAYFYGPALKIAKEINTQDNIVLDLTPQYSKIITQYYFVTVMWDGLEYLDDKVFLFDVDVIGDLVGNLNYLDSKNYIIIDTALHEENIHVFNLVYPARFLDEYGVTKC